MADPDETSSKAPQSEGALRESLDRLNLILSHVPLILSAVNLKGEYILSEGRGLAAIGRKPGEIRTATVFEQFQDRPDILGYIRAAMAGKSVQAVVELSGQILELNYEPLRDDSGRIIGVVALSQVVTERKRVEASLRESESKLKTIFNLLPIGVSVLDEKRNISFMNPALGRVLAMPADGLSKGEFVQRSYLRVDGSPMPPEEFASVRAAAENRPVMDVVTGVVKEDGEVIWTNVSSVPVAFSDWKLINVVTDITERKLLERRLEKRVRELTAFYRLAELTERSGPALDALYREFVKVLPGSWQYPDAAYARIVVDGHAYQTDNFRTTPWAQAAAIHVSGAPAGMIEVGYLEEKPIQDEGPFLKEERYLLESLAERLGRISERVRGEKAVARALREKEALLRELHHRVKNNLQVISSLFRMQTGNPPPGDCEAVFRQAQTRIRAMSLVHEKFYQATDVSNIDLAGYVQSLAIFLFHTYLDIPDRVKLELNCERITLDVNSATPFGLILNELISNALKHAFPDGRKGRIRISLRRPAGEAIELRVEDDGVGFPEGADFRRDGGFGLRIVQVLVGQLDGTIAMERNGGTGFIVSFNEIKRSAHLEAALRGN